MSKKILLIDDRRSPKIIPTGDLDSNGKTEYFKDEDVHVADTYDKGIEQLRDHQWDLLLLDHDLGSPVDSETGYGILCWLEENSEHIPAGIKLVTANPSGGQKMLQVIKKLEDEGKTTYKGWV